MHAYTQSIYTYIQYIEIYSGYFITFNELHRQQKSQLNERQHEKHKKKEK